HNLPGILDVSYMGSKVRVIVRDLGQGQVEIQNYLLHNRIADAAVHQVSPTMEDIFVGLAEGGVERWNMQ
ncbi:MAG TPA: hypothetical protein PKI17_02330, partial [Syntrophomonas sp.]|nr:hypothetical protein [Syntrophomonas sp.]